MMKKLDKQTWEKLEYNYNNILMIADDIIRDCKNPDFKIDSYKMWIMLYVTESVELLKRFDNQDNLVMILKDNFELLQKDFYNLTAINQLEDIFERFNPF